MIVWKTELGREEDGNFGIFGTSHKYDDEFS